MQLSVHLSAQIMEPVLLQTYVAAHLDGQEVPVKQVYTPIYIIININFAIVYQPKRFSHIARYKMGNLNCDNSSQCNNKII